MFLMFGKGKKKSLDPQAATLVVSVSSRLRELCGPDEEMYSALSRLMFLDPKKIVSPFETVLSEAQDNETKGNTLRAEVGYRIAGSMSLWTGDAEGVRKYFTKASTFAGEARPEYRTVAKRADDAVSIARKYYEASEPPTKK
jgi:hypothetical protein